MKAASPASSPTLVSSAAGAALAAARSRGVASLDAQLLLARLLGTTRTGLLAHDEQMLSAGQHADWTALLERRAGGEPLAYLLGEKEFHGLLLEVSPAVLVPRPETELLVDWGTGLIGSELPGDAAAIDLGTGSGAIALALKALRPQARVTASDASAEALLVAGRNAASLGLALDLAQGSWWQPFASRRFHLAISNPPYVAAGDAHLDALRYEPRMALTPGGDGLSALAEIVAGAPDRLEAGGWLLLEHGFDQAAAVRGLLRQAGFGCIETRLDLAGLERASGGRLSP